MQVNRDERRMIIASAVASVMISVVSITLDDTINPDGYLYLKSAEHLLQGNVPAALDLYGWPFYSGLIALVSWIFRLDPEYSAYAINTLCFALLTVSFLSSIKISGGGKEEVVGGALLLLSHPGWNRAYRTYIMRDSGYWAFFMLGFVFFLQYWKEERPRYAWGWAGAMLTASLFRIEGMVLLFGVPLLFLVRRETPFRRRIALLLQAWLLPLAVGAIVFVMLMLRGGESSVALGRLPEFLDFFRDSILGLNDMLQEKADALRVGFFTGVAQDYSRDYLIPSAFSIFLVVIVMETVGAFTPLYLVPLCYSVYRRVWRRMTGFSVSVWFGILNLLILTAFVFRRYFLTGRYPMPLVLILLAICAFGSAEFYRTWREQRYSAFRFKVIGRIVVMGWVILFLSGFVSFSPSKEYINDAGLWIQERATVETVVYSNVPSLLYRTKVKNQRMLTHTEVDVLRSLLSGEEAGYVALRVRGKDREWQEALSRLDQRPVQVFSNRVGDKVVVYSMGMKRGTAGE